jgi:hypothetical protein
MTLVVLVSACDPIYWAVATTHFVEPVPAPCVQSALASLPNTTFADSLATPPSRNRHLVAEYHIDRPAGHVIVKEVTDGKGVGVLEVSQGWFGARPTPGEVDSAVSHISDIAQHVQTECMATPITGWSPPRVKRP